MHRNKYQQRPFDHIELVKQIGAMTVLGISGGRVGIITNEQDETIEIILPVSKGYRVAITLGWADTWIVRREFVRKGKVFVKGVVDDVYCEQISEVAYQASCYVNVPFGESVEQTNKGESK